MSKKYEFSDDILRGILYLSKADREFFVQTTHMIEPEYFDTNVQSATYQVIKEYFDKYRTLPSDALILEGLKEKDLDEVESELTAELHRINAIQKESIKHKEAYLDMTEKFAKERAMKEAIISGISLMEEGRVEEIENEVKRALKVGRHSDLGLSYRNDYEGRYERFYGMQAVEDRFGMGFPGLDGPLHGGLARKEMGIIVANSGCHRKGQGILMYDGSIKKVEDIKIGDQLMGPDSKPRNVLGLCRGKENMIEIQPVKGSKPFVVNENHVLHLKTNYSKAKETYLTTTVKNHLNADFQTSHNYKLYRVPVEFEKKDPLPVDPYIVGIMLGDGTLTRCPAITSMDAPIILYFKRYIQDIHEDLHIREAIKTGKSNKAKSYYVAYKKGHTNKFVEHLQEADIWGFNCGNKLIPHNYKTSSREDRLQLLAGLMDTDGSLSKGRNCFDFINKSKQLVEDVSFVARSLGLQVSTITEKTAPKICDTVYYRICISGDTDIIPCKLDRKKASSRKQIKDPLVTGFKMVDLQKEEDYYGFELDEDHLYLLDDFTVTHNSGKSLFLCRQGLYSAMRNLNVLYISLEMSEDSIMARLDTMLTKMDYKTIRDNHDIFIERVKKASPLVRGEYLVKQFPSLLTTPSKVRAYLEYCQNILDKKFDVLIVDYLELMRPSVKDLPEYEAQQRIAQELRGIAVEYNLVVWSATQANRQGASARNITETELAGSFGKIREVDFSFSINQDDDERKNGQARLYVMKSRNARSRYVVNVDINYKTLQINEVEDEDGTELD